MSVKYKLNNTYDDFKFSPGFSAKPIKGCTLPIHSDN